MGYKLKTHSGAAKRFKKTGSSVKRRPSYEAKSCSKVKGGALGLAATYCFITRTTAAAAASNAPPPCQDVNLPDYGAITSHAV